MLSYTSNMSKNTNTINGGKNKNMTGSKLKEKTDSSDVISMVDEFINTSEFKGGKLKDNLKDTIMVDVSDSANHNNLNVSEIFKFMDLFFDRYGIIFAHLYNSYNKFLEEDVKTFLELGDHTFFERVTKDKIIKYKFKYENISFRGPSLENDIEPMFPSDARNRNLTYGGKLIAKVTQLQEITDIATGNISSRVLGHPEDNVPIANIPVMIRSKMCSLNTHKGYDKRECEFDLGGYFNVGGQEKVVISQDRMVENKPLVFIKKDSGVEIYTVQVNSKSYRPHGLTQIINIRMKKDGNITIRVPILNEVPVFILFRALGIESDRDIINPIVNDDNDFEMITAMETSLDYSRNDKNDKIQTQQDAVDYLINKMRVIKKYTETDKTIRNQQRRIHLMDLLKNSFLPHIEGDLKTKAYYLGYMVNKLLKCYLGRIQPDDRDSYLNKRIDLPGDLLFELFKQFYRKMINECNKFFKKRNSNDQEPLVIINQIKPNIIEQGIKASLMTGAWPRRKGVAQMLQRYSFLQAVAFLRRIDAPGGDASTSKVTGPRHLHPSTACLACCLTGDTEILMGDNASVKRIDEIKDGNVIWSSHKNDLSETPTKIKNYFSRKADKLVEITTISGRKLKCTLDHPILVRQDGKHIMIDAGKLKVGDEVITRHTQKLLNDNTKTNVVLKSKDMDEFYRLDLQTLGYTDRELSQETLEITARLIGLLGNNGYMDNQNNKYNVQFTLSGKDDINNITSDIIRLGFSNYHNLVVNDTTINITGVFAYYLHKMGNMTVPEWVKNSNLNIKREFLSGYMGTESYGQLLAHNNSDAYTIVYNSNEDIKYLAEIAELFTALDIECVVQDRKLLFKNTNDNLVKYCDTISFRYCNSYNYMSAPVIEYIKYKNNQADGTIIKYDEFVTKYYIGKNNLAMPIQKINELPGEMTYDFETCSDTHTIIANGFITSNCVSTPEHAKVGLTKHLGLISSITILQTSQINILKSYFKKKITDMRDVSSETIKEMTVVFLNGEPLGLTNEPVKLEAELRKNKLNGTFEPTISITHNIPSKEIHVYCDGGRMYAPFIRIVDNKAKLTKELVHSTSLNKSQKSSKITSWDEFTMKHNDVIENLDMEELPYFMIADNLQTVETERRKMIDSIDKVKNVKSNKIDDRYDDMMFSKYSHCIFHPSLLLAEIPTNIPFCNHNDGPRNIFQYSYV